MNEKVKIIDAWLHEQVGCPYIFGGTKQTCTPAYRKARIAQYSKYADLIANNCQRLKSGKSSCNGCKWAIDGVGRLAYDCAQLVRFAFKEIGIILVSGADPQWNKTAFVYRGLIKDMPKNLLCIVYREDDDGKKHHTGMYLGNGHVIHAKGHNDGVVNEPLESVKLTHFAIPAGLYSDAELRAYGFEPGLNLPTLRRGATGEAVKKFQNGMKTLGYAIEADGIFGEKTEEIAKSFQKKHSLTVDGVVGPKTWGVFVTLIESEPEHDKDDMAGTDEPPKELKQEDTVAVSKKMLIEWANCLEEKAFDIRKIAEEK